MFEAFLYFILSCCALRWIYAETSLRGFRCERDAFRKMELDAIRADFLANIGEG